MDKTMKKLICLVLAAIMICALVGCNSVSQSDIDELQQRIAQLEDKNKELEGELRDQKLKFEDKLTQQESKFEDELNEQKSEYEGKLNEQKSEYEDKLNEQDKKIEDMQKDINYLEQKTKGIDGAFYSVYDAYENGWLTREDLMHISYFRTGQVIEYDAETGTDRKIEFEPTMPEPKLTERVERGIKYEFYKEHQADFEREFYFFEPDGHFDEKIALDWIRIKFYGEYNGAYAVEISSIYVVPGIVKSVGAGDIYWEQSYPLIEIFKFN